MENQGLQLKKSIKSIGLSQEEAASKLGMTRQNLTNYLNKSALPGDFIEKVKEDLDIDLANSGKKKDEINELIVSKNEIIDLQRQLLKVKDGTIADLTEKLKICEQKIGKTG